MKVRITVARSSVKNVFLKIFQSSLEKTCFRDFSLKLYWKRRRCIPVKFVNIKKNIFDGTHSGISTKLRKWEIRLTHHDFLCFPTNCLNVFEHFVWLKLKGSTSSVGHPLRKSNSSSNKKVISTLQHLHIVISFWSHDRSIYALGSYK